MTKNIKELELSEIFIKANFTVIARLGFGKLQKYIWWMSEKVLADGIKKKGKSNGRR